jgi:hypothetical protein
MSFDNFDYVLTNYDLLQKIDIECSEYIKVREFNPINIKNMKLACIKCLEPYYFDYNFLNNIYQIFYYLLKTCNDQEYLEIFKNQLEVLGNSKTSIIYKAQFKNGIYQYVIKSLDLEKIKIDSKESLDLLMNSFLHEFLIGIYSINGLRNFIPNYNYTFGIKNETTPEINLIMEYIDGITFQNYLIKIINLDFDINIFNEFILIYIQIMLSLHIGQEQLLFTHYDLHCKNVMIKTLNKEQDLYYPTLKETYIIKNIKKYPVILDYGHSSCESFKDFKDRISLKHYMAIFGKYRYYNPAYDAHELNISIKMILKHFKPREGKIGHMIHLFITFLIKLYYNFQIDNPDNPIDYIDDKYFKDNHGNFFKKFLHEYIFRPSLFIVDFIKFLNNYRKSNSININLDIIDDKSRIEIISCCFIKNPLKPFKHSKLFLYNFHYPYKESLKDERIINLREIVYQLDSLIKHNKDYYYRWNHDLKTIPNLYFLEKDNITNLNLYINFKLIERDEIKWSWDQFMEFYYLIKNFIENNNVIHDFPLVQDNLSYINEKIIKLFLQQWRLKNPSDSNDDSIILTLHGQYIEKKIAQEKIKLFIKLFKESEIIQDRISEMEAIDALEKYKNVIIFLNRHFNDIILNYHKYNTIILFLKNIET